MYVPKWYNFSAMEFLQASREEMPSISSLSSPVIHIEVNCDFISLTRDKATKSNCAVPGGTLGFRWRALMELGR